MLPFLHFFMFSNSPTTFTFHADGLVPYDGVPLEEDVSIDLPLTIIFSTLATAGIAFAVACLTFNCIFMNKKWVISSCNCVKFIMLSHDCVHPPTQADTYEQPKPELPDRGWCHNLVYGYLFRYHPHYQPTSSADCVLQCHPLADCSGLLFMLWHHSC